MGKKGIAIDGVRRTAAVQAVNDFSAVAPGLNYLGRCQNAACPAHKKSVARQRGMGSSVVNDDVSSDVLKCPKCHTPFELTEIALYQCTATVIVHSHDSTTTTHVAEGNEVVRLGSNGKAPGSDPLPRTSGDCLVEIVTRRSGRRDCIIA